MASPLETINASSNAPESSSHTPPPPECSASSASDRQAPSASPPCEVPDLPSVEGDNNIAGLDDFLNWGPWADDKIRYPGGFWNQTASPPIETRRPLEIDQSEAAAESDEDPDKDEISDDHNTAEDYTEDDTEEDTENEGVEEEVSNKQDVTTQNEKECTVCLENVAAKLYPDLPHAAGSQHSSDVCLHC